MEMKDKKMVILGDSITAGSGVTDISNRFDNCLLREAKLREVKNYGVGGTRIAEQHTPSINKKSVSAQWTWKPLLQCVECSFTL